MKTKRIRLFEDFKEQYIKENEVLESVYADWKKSVEFNLKSIFEYFLQEDIEDDDDRELPLGKKLL